MTLTKEKKQELFVAYGAKKTAHDTGSATSQVALFTSRIAYLTEHLKKHPKDKASMLGLTKLVGKRKRQLNYLQNRAIESYRDIIAKLGLRK